MFKRLKLLDRYLGRQRRPAFVAVGYPKVGNTWLRLTLGRYFQDIANLPKIPLFDIGEFAALEDKLGGKGIGYFTHDPLKWQNQTASDLTYENTVAPFKGLKVILLTRHPLDVAVSFYMHVKYKLPAAKAYPGTIEDFIYDPVFGLQKLFRFYELWRDYQDRASNCFLWRYECARANPLGGLEELVRFLQWPYCEKVAESAVEYASFDNMKRMEHEGESILYSSSGFNIFGDGDRENPNAYHVRKGEIGGFRHELPVPIINSFEHELSRFSEFFQYS